MAISRRHEERVLSVGGAEPAVCLCGWRRLSHLNGTERIGRWLGDAEACAVVCVSAAPSIRRVTCSPLPSAALRIPRRFSLDGRSEVRKRVLRNLISSELGAFYGDYAAVFTTPRRSRPPEPPML